MQLTMIQAKEYLQVGRYAIFKSLRAKSLHVLINNAGTAAWLAGLREWSVVGRRARDQLRQSHAGQVAEIVPCSDSLPFPQR